MCFRLKGRSDSGWRTRPWENWMMLKSLMAWLERRLYTNVGESRTLRCVCVHVCVCACRYLTDFIFFFSSTTPSKHVLFQTYTHNSDLYLSDDTFQWCVQDNYCTLCLKSRLHTVSSLFYFFYFFYFFAVVYAPVNTHDTEIFPTLIILTHWP